MRRKLPVVRTTPKPGEKLLPTQRQSFILDVLGEQGAATLHQLSDRLGASFSTVRRDLDELSRNGLVRRTHGGATLYDNSVMESRPDNTPSDQIRAMKQEIGALAAARIQDGNSVIFDSSTTVLEAARVIAGSPVRITAVTNSLQIAETFASSDRIRLIVPGGSRRPGTYMFAGEPGDSFISQLHADVAFIGAQSASDGFLTDSRVESASIKRLLMKAARIRILLIDSWKFGGPGFCTVAPLSEFEQIITDRKIAESELKELERRGITVRIAGQPAI
jgi:DeoR family transcriptional regulator of aga operon